MPGFNRRDRCVRHGNQRVQAGISRAPFEVRRLIDQFEHRYRVGPGDVVIDAGSFNGILMSIFALQVGSSGRVLAFEPDANQPAEDVAELGIERTSGARRDHSGRTLGLQNRN